MFQARPLNAFPAVAAQALLGSGIGYFLGGPVPATVLAFVASVASFAIRMTARHPHESGFRQLVLAAILTALHLAALYTIGDDGTTPLLSAHAQFVLAGFGLAAFTGFAARKRSQLAMIPTAEIRSRDIEDDDPTIEIEPQPQLPPTGPASPGTSPRTRLRSPLALGVLSCALFVVSVVFWLGDDGAPDALGGAVARELPAQDPQLIAAVEAGESADLPLPATPAPAAEADSNPPPATGSGAIPDNAVAPSAARRECMAQIESAHLFLQIARQSDDADQYARATGSQIARMLEHRPVGPRTLARIAERMWAQRDAPEKNAGWWSSQFSRCEAARSGGSWYVVRG